MAKSSEHISFPGSDGSLLAARLDAPTGPVKAWALFAHCFTCSKDMFVVGRIAAGLNAQGIGVLRFDFTGLGQSEGEFADSTFSSDLDDLRAAQRWLAENRSAPQIIIGHSLGGTAVLAVAGEFDSVRAVATVGAPAQATHVEALFDDSLTEIHAEGASCVSIGGRPFTIKDEFVHDLAEHPIAEKVANLGAALLVAHSPVDNIVGIDNASEIFLAARHPKSFLSLDGTDHLVSRREDAVYLADTIAAWSSRYITDENPPLPDVESSAPVVVSETGQHKYVNTVVAGDHRFLSDEPEHEGGLDAGPNPYKLLSAALGSCTSMTLRMYADRRKYPLDRVYVEILHRKDKIEVPDEKRPGKTRRTLQDVFTRIVHVEGDELTEEQRDDLLRISDRCPVHKTLTRTAVIESELG